MKIQTQPTSSPTVVPGFSNRHSPLATYLTGAACAGATWVAPQVDAAVTAVTFGLGPVIGSNGNPASVDPLSYSNSVGGFGFLHVNNLAESFFLGRMDFYHYDPDLGPTSRRYGTVYENASGGIYQGLPTFFEGGTVIGGQGFGNGNNGWIGSAYFNHQTNPSLSFTTDQLNKNIAFRTNNDHWGWANVSWNATNQTLTINEAFVESVPLTPITIPVTIPEPSGVLLGLAGIGGAALRRKRKLTAF